MSWKVKKVAITTLGCKTNQAESYGVMHLLTENGYESVPFDERADAYIINTCTVTNMSDKKSRQLIRRARSMNRDAIVIAMGCYAQVSPEEVISLEELDYIVGTSGKTEILHILDSVNGRVAAEGERKEVPAYGRNLVTDIFKVNEFEDMPILSVPNSTRAFIKIQEGCTSFCTYCIIPYARGKLRSRSIASIVDEAGELARSGFREVLLTGIHIGSYGAEHGYRESLIDVIEAIHGVQGIERIRLGSVEPGHISAEFVERLKKLPKVCDHFHLSLQSGSDSVLKRMKRKYTKSEYLEVVRRLREVYPNAGFTTDIIVGFPGETQEEFHDSVNLVRRVGFLDVHIFPFSPRSGTPAATYPNQISGEVKKHRVKALQIVADSVRETFLRSQIGREFDLILEGGDEGGFIGYTSNYIRLRYEGEEGGRGDMVSMKFVSPTQLASSEERE